MCLGVLVCVVWFASVVGELAVRFGVAVALRFWFFGAFLDVLVGRLVDLGFVDFVGLGFRVVFLLIYFLWVL